MNLALLLFVAILFFYIVLLLHKCMDLTSLIKTYLDIGKVAFGYKGRIMVSIFMYLELYLVALEFLILECGNLKETISTYEFQSCWP